MHKQINEIKVSICLKKVIYAGFYFENVYFFCVKFKTKKLKVGVTFLVKLFLRKSY